MKNSDHESNPRKYENNDSSQTQNFSCFRKKARLAPNQHDLYLYNLIHPENNTFNIGFSVNLGSDIDKIKWEEAIRWIIQHDDITRSHILSNNDEPLQIVDPQSPVFFEYVEFTESLINTRTAEEYLWEQNDKVIDLSTPPLLKNFLIKDRHKQYIAGLIVPHILFDGIAAQVFFSRVDYAYSILLKEKSLEEKEFPSFFDYIEKDYPVFDSPETQEYWYAKLQNVVSFDFPLSMEQSKKNVLKKICLDSGETYEIKEFCTAHSYHLYTFFMTVYAFLLQRYADCEEDFIVFNVLAGRPKEHLSTLGCFYQVLPCLFPKDILTNAESISDIIDYVGQYRKKLGPHQNISFPLSNKILMNPKIKCFYNYQSFAVLNMLSEKRTLEIYMKHPDDEIHLAVTDVGDSVELELYYNENKFPYCDFLERLRHLALQVCRKNVPFLNELNILLDNELDRLVARDQAASVEREPALMVHKQFEAQVAKYPDKEALTLPNDVGCISHNSKQTPNQKKTLTYRELNEKANQLAHYLQDLGIGPDDLVALCLDRSMDLVVAILGIVKAGGAYVPLDPDYPQDRLNFMLKDSNASVLITKEPLEGLFSPDNCRVVCMDSNWDSIEQKSTQNPDSSVSFQNLAYVIYTSGSTGRPKGVLVTHGNVSRLFKQTENWFAFNDRDVWTLFHSCSFDFSVWEFWGAIIYGGRLVIVSKSVSRSPEAFYTVLHQEKVTILNQTPSAFYSIIRIETSLPAVQPLALRYVIFGGEALNLMGLKPWVDRHGDREPRLINMYGITETTVHVTYRPITREDIEQGLGSVIGSPIPDLRVYLLDKKQRPIPPGLPGEIFVGGAGVARGYLNRPELTVEKFISDPFTGDPELRMYRSGDLGRMLPGGDIEYLGRIDDQVKVRGFRIELEEISATLLNHAAISQAVVVSSKQAQGNPEKSPATAENRLVAYLVTNTGKRLTISGLRKFLESRLPDYMIPSAFVFLDHLPLTSNGKLDRQVLPQPDTTRPDLEQIYVTPRNSTEKGLVNIFKDILNIDKVGVHDDFFMLGGHSLAAMQLAVRARQLFNIHLPIDKIFEMPTVAELADYLITESDKDDVYPPPELKFVPRDAPIPVSFSQERVWFILQLNPENRAYEFQSTLRFIGPLNIEVLKKSLTEIVQRHEVYRTTFHEVNGEASQVIHAPWSVTLPLTDLSKLSSKERDSEVKRLIHMTAQDPFQLDKLPLVRWSLLRLSDDEHILIHHEHHIIHDGWSFIVFLRELLELYGAFSENRLSSLPKPSIQFADFAYWQRQWMQSSVAKKQLAYWKEKLGGAPTQLELPFDRQRPASQSFRGDALRLDLPFNLTRLIDSFSRQNGVTVYMTMLAAFFTLLYRYTSQEDIVVGTGVANRRWAETENLLGMIINNIALRINLSGNLSFRELALRIRETALEAYENQDVPFDQVVEVVNPVRSTSYSPIFQAIFTSYDGPMPALKLPGLSIKLEEGLNNGSAKFDLNVIVISRCKQDPDGISMEDVNTVSLIWEYNTDLFDQVTMRRMVDSYLHILQYAIRDDEQRLSEIPLITDSERNMLLLEFNRTQTSYPHEATIHTLFEDQAASMPEAIALVFEDQRLTYQELNTRANQLAHYLRKIRVGPEVLVGICMERSMEMVVGILGILKAGGAYVPLDPDYPKQRLSFMICDTKLQVILTQSRLAEDLPDHDIELICLDTDWAKIAGESDQNPVGYATADNLAYVMYTSGSTGKPKGVCIIHRGVVRLVRETNYINLSADEIFLQFAPISFDASTFEIWAPLLNGARCVLFPNRMPGLKELAQVVRKHQVSTLWLTASLYNAIIDEEPEALKGVGQLLIGGEALSVPHVRLGLQRLPYTQIINGYGPTENTTFTCCYRIPKELDQAISSIPIGRPIANTTVYILDAHLNPVPIGVVGELYIGGDGLGREYLNRPELSAERFIENPFSDKHGQCLYRTGDLVRYLPDGNIEFRGRVDNQVKIRGFRIELGEIESVLNAHESVGEAVVLLREDQYKDKHLLGYIVPVEKEPLSIDDLRAYMRNRLPDYMVPSYFVQMDSMPLTPNGKIDKNALLHLDAHQRPENGFVLPRTDVEKRIASVWCEILQIEKVGIFDNFFDLGGHSLLATKVVSRLSKNFMINLPISSMFENPTIASFASFVETFQWARNREKMQAGSKIHGWESGEL